MTTKTSKRKRQEDTLKEEPIAKRMCVAFDGMKQRKRIVHHILQDASVANDAEKQTLLVISAILSAEVFICDIQCMKNKTMNMLQQFLNNPAYSMYHPLITEYIDAVQDAVKTDITQFPCDVCQTQFESVYSQTTCPVCWTTCMTE